ncbi:GNAT family N-acetyltransferase [Vallitalea okinawensis]|uniref:GNAT family N-acetyltransferase n=1 Tax=Vallitalea okinawensis TaxID=2078660 RepID=UPI000CFDECE7|nr:GNAT family N-acetyltransferase [Vallitalea okinawensis]
MRILALDENKLEAFKAYCRIARKDVDESYLYDSDLEKYKINDENITYIALSDLEEIIGVCSVIWTPYFRKANHGRIRILHAMDNNKEVYEALIAAVNKEAYSLGIGSIFLFNDILHKEVAAIIESRGFRVERYSYLMVRSELPIEEISPLEGFIFRSFVEVKDEEDWCHVRNQAFQKLAGSTTPITPDMVKDMCHEEDCIKNGMIMLYKNDCPIGIIRISKEEEEKVSYGFISSLAVIPEYQHQGLGRLLLRKGILFAREHNLKHMMLCVNAENEQALTLYKDEGFKNREVMVCYRLHIKAKS